MEKLIQKANILCEALPYIRLWTGKTVVIKYGGNAMNNESTINTIMQDVTLLKMVGVNPILVHGGGPEINATLKALGIESKFYKGLRITDEATMTVVQMVMCGKINKDIVSRINRLGVKAIGLCGKDASLIEAAKMPPVDGVDLGCVGKITSVNVEILKELSNAEYVPVVAGIGYDAESGQSYNINADTAAGEIAAFMKADKLIYMTDIDGIRESEDDPQSLISVISPSKIKKMKEGGQISGGMIPKVDSCVSAIERGVPRVHILNGTIPHAILLEMFTDKGIGTMVTKETEN